MAPLPAAAVPRTLFSDSASAGVGVSAPPPLEYYVPLFDTSLAHSPSARPATVCSEAGTQADAASFNYCAAVSLDFLVDADVGPAPTDLDFI